ncbi:MAG: hypothetical protein ACK5XN_14645 [Bacteroidota bacterium]
MMRSDPPIHQVLCLPAMVCNLFQQLRLLALFFNELRYTEQVLYEFLNPHDFSPPYILRNVFQFSTASCATCRATARCSLVNPTGTRIASTSVTELVRVALRMFAAFFRSVLITPQR